MSFILDALRRAETQRGNQPRTMASDSALGEIAEKPSSMPSRPLIAISLGAAVIVAVLAMTLTGRHDRSLAPSEQTVAARSPAPTFPTVSADTPLSDVITPATREVRPLVREARPPVPAHLSPGSSQQPRSIEEPGSVAAPAGRITPGTVTYSQEPLTRDDAPATRNVGNLPDNEQALPSYADLVLSGRSALPEFHLDIHVYAAAPERRFVFVNNRKYREGDQLDEGGTVERITPHGVVLNHRGRRFQLIPD